MVNRPLLLLVPHLKAQVDPRRPVALVQVATLELCFAVEELAEEAYAQVEALGAEAVCLINNLSKPLNLTTSKPNYVAAKRVLGDVAIRYIQFVRYELFEGSEPSFGLRPGVKWLLNCHLLLRECFLPRHYIVTVSFL